MAGSSRAPSTICAMSGAKRACKMMFDERRPGIDDRRCRRVATDPLKFRDEKRYADRLKRCPR